MTPMTAAALSSVPVRQGRRRLRDVEHVPPGRRRPRDRGHGSDSREWVDAALADGASKIDAFMNGLHHALYVAAVIAFAAALTALVTVRSHARSRLGVERVAQRPA